MLRRPSKGSSETLVSAAEGLKKQQREIYFFVLMGIVFAVRQLKLQRSPGSGLHYFFFNLTRPCSVAVQKQMGQSSNDPIDNFVASLSLVSTAKVSPDANRVYQAAKHIAFGSMNSAGFSRSSRRESVWLPTLRRRSSSATQTASREARRSISVVSSLSPHEEEPAGHAAGTSAGAPRRSLKHAWS